MLLIRPNELIIKVEKILHREVIPISSSTFALFLFIFLQVDHNLMTLIRENAPLGAYLDPNIASFSVFLECVFSGIMATFILVNFFRTDNVNTDRIENVPAPGTLGDS